MVRKLDARARKLILAILCPLLLLGALVTWGFASPPGSSPDDDFHLASIWCGLGERPGLCESTGDPASLERSVPVGLIDSLCPRFQQEQSGACFDREATGMITVSRANIDALYPPVFYGTLSVFASPDISWSVAAMRIFNSVLFVGVLTTLFFALPRRLRPALVVSVATTIIPLGLFIIPSTNPSSWALLSAAVVWISVYGVTQTTGRARTTLVVLALFGAGLGIGARADSAVFALFGAGLGLLLGARLRPIRSNLVAVAITALIGVGAIITYLSTSQGGDIVGGLSSERAPFTVVQQVDNFLEVPLLWTGAFGGWGLGWLDTPLPSAVWIFNTLVCGGAVFLGLQGARVRRSAVFLLAFAAMWLVPAYLLVQSRVVVGETIQPRYILPLIIIAVGVASLRFDAERAWRGMPFVLAAGTLAVIDSVALHQLIKRYTTGTDRPSLNPGFAAEWWWPGIPSPAVTWVLGTCMFAAALVGLWFALRWPRAVAETASAGQSASPQTQHVHEDAAERGDEQDERHGDERILRPEQQR